MAKKFKFVLLLLHHLRSFNREYMAILALLSAAFPNLGWWIKKQLDLELQRASKCQGSLVFTRVGLGESFLKGRLSTAMFFKGF